MNLKNGFKSHSWPAGQCDFFDRRHQYRWIGNERGMQVIHCKVNPDKLGTEAGWTIFQHRDPSGTIFQSEKADVSHPSRLDFYHEDQDPKISRELVEITFLSRARNSSCLIFRRIKLGSLMQRILNDFMICDLSQWAPIKKIWLWSWGIWSALSADFACRHLWRQRGASSWANVQTCHPVELDLGSPKTFDVIELREDLKLGQRIAAFMW